MANNPNLGVKKTKSAAVQLPAQTWWQKYMAYLLPALAFLLYANTIGNGYNMDDELVTRKHKLTSKGISAIPGIFTSPYYSDDMGYSYEYRPMVLTSFAVEHQFFGDKPAVSHFFNVLLYALTVLVLFRLLRRLLHAYPYMLTVLAVLLFVFHPIHTETIASIKNRDEILALLFGLLAWKYALDYARSGKHGLLLPITVLFAAGLLSKASITPLMVLVPLSTLFFLTPAGVPVLLTGLGLSGTAFLFTPSPNPMGVLPLYVLAGLLPGVVWLFFHGKIRSVWEGLKTNSGHFVRGVRTVSGEDFTVGFLKPEWSFRELLAPLFLVQAGLFAVLATMAVVWYDPRFITAAFLLFAVGFYAGTDGQKNGWLVLFALFFSTVGFTFGYSDYVEFGPLFVGTLFFMDRRFKNYWTLGALVLVGLPMIHFGTVPDYILTLVVLVLLALREKFRWARLAVWFPITVITVILVLAAYRVVLEPEIAWGEFITQLINVLLILTAFCKTRRWVRYILLFLVFPFFFWGNYNDLSRNADTQTPAPSQEVAAPPVIRDSLSTATLMGIVKAERPISFAEVPVSGSSPMKERLGTAMDVLGFYLQKMLLPYPLGYYYGYAYFKPVSITEPVPLLVLAVHLALFVWALLAYRRHRPLSFALLFYLMAIALFSGFLYPVVGMVGDRFSYVASLGFCLAVAYLAVRYLGTRETGVSAEKTKPLFLGVVGVVLLGYGMFTLIRNTQWKDALTLMGHDIDYLDESAQAHNLYALNLMKESYDGKKFNAQQQYNMRKLALTHFERALEIWPGFFNAAYDKGRVGTIIGDLPKAIEGYEASIRIGPAPGFMEPYYQLTELYLKTGRYPEYLVNARRIFVLEHNRAEPYNLMAKAHFLNGQTDSAKAYLRQGMEVFPGDQSLRKNMAEVFKNQGMADSAAYYGAP